MKNHKPKGQPSTHAHRFVLDAPEGEVVAGRCRCGGDAGVPGVLREPGKHWNGPIRVKAK